MKIKKKIKFKGWDWVELADFFKIKHEWNVDSEIESKPLRDFLKRAKECLYFDEERVKESKYIIKICRLYLKSFIKGAKKVICGVEIFEGMSKIKEDEVFLDYFILLLTHLWY